MRTLALIAFFASAASVCLAQTAPAPAPSAAPADRSASARATLYLVSSPGQTTAEGTRPTIHACRIAAGTAADPGNRSVIVSTGNGWVAFICVPGPN